MHNMLSLNNLLDLGKLLRAERKALGMTQSAMAKAAGLRRETIIRLEAGENVDMITFLKAVAAVNKAIRLVDKRHDYETMKELFSGD